ncbi:hypothetical protein GN958_ATG16545 [Phytophthora infestans]|uniref:Uncharacterized protein n=1 Tax=Phytophthora infestans TaxID=4787 RepID=A0A8S9TZN6_PHYIN|nr:hypothetical protein GN958_ATG16545 [Phytophthora infestans]
MRRLAPHHQGKDEVIDRERNYKEQAATSLKSNIGPPLSQAHVFEFNGSADLTQNRRSERISSRNVSWVLSAAHFTLRELIQKPINLRKLECPTNGCSGKRQFETRLLLYKPMTPMI